MSASGKRLLEDGWQTLIDPGPTGDLDSDLRVALGVMWGGGDQWLAAGFLMGSADKKLEAIPVVGATDHTDPVVPLARRFTDPQVRTMKALLEA